MIPHPPPALRALPVPVVSCVEVPVTVVKFLQGTGVAHDPVREITRFYAKDVMLAQHDPWVADAIPAILNGYASCPEVFGSDMPELPQLVNRLVDLILRQNEMLAAAEAKPDHTDELNVQMGVIRLLEDRLKGEKGRADLLEASLPPEPGLNDGRYLSVIIAPLRPVGTQCWWAASKEVEDRILRLLPSTAGFESCWICRPGEAMAEFRSLNKPDTQQPNADVLAPAGEKTPTKPQDD